MVFTYAQYLLETTVNFSRTTNSATDIMDNTISAACKGNVTLVMTFDL